MSICSINSTQAKPDEAADSFVIRRRLLERMTPASKEGLLEWEVQLFAPCCDASSL